ncbi:MAG TPA: hypothetical protein VK550_17945 [Polyangiaceae bacterium]|nr:hypothetical protein [Polyangiaceae bacterium]
MSTHDFEVCIGCGIHAPKTDTNYTLISPKFGWRLSRRAGPQGTFIVEWRCADCWSKHKEKQGEGSRQPGAARRSRRPPPSS